MHPIMKQALEPFAPKDEAKVAHTPGPWVFEDYSQEAPKFFVIPSTYHGTVAKAFNEADARLIAASPTMLDALRQCQRALAMMIAPDAIQQTTTLNAFEQATAAELAARKAIALVDEAQSKAAGK